MAPRSRRETCRLDVLADCPDDFDQFVERVALLAGELDEVSCLLDNCALLGSGGDGDAAPSAELEQAFVAEGTESAQHGVRVDAHDGGKISGWWQSFAWFGFTVCDGTTDRCGGYRRRAAEPDAVTHAAPSRVT